MRRWRRKGNPMVVVEMEGQRLSLYVGDTIDVAITTHVNETQGASALVGSITSKTKIKVVSVD